MFGPRNLSCSFCRKSEHDVAKLVAGRGVYICDECVDVARRMMDEDASGDDRPPAPVPIWTRLWIRIRRLTDRLQMRRTAQVGGARAIAPIHVKT